MSINRAIISGNLTRDAELRQTQSGSHVLSFSVAVNERVKNGDQWEDRPNFIECTMFGKRAESIAKYMTKGAKVCAEGKLRWSQWEKDGQKRSKVEVVVDEIEFMSRSESAASSEHSYGYSAPSYGAPAYDGSASVYDEDIPF